MSFSFSRTNTPAQELQQAIMDDQQLPPSVKCYLYSSIVALQRRLGPDIPVSVSAYGHLFTGEEGNYDVSTATISVQRGVEAIKEGEDAQPATAV